jgi:hypothetical protein
MNQNFEIWGNFLLNLLKPFPGLFFIKKYLKKEPGQIAKKLVKPKPRRFLKKTKTCPTFVAAY